MSTTLNLDKLNSFEQDSKEFYTEILESIHSHHSIQGFEIAINTGNFPEILSNLTVIQFESGNIPIKTKQQINLILSGYYGEHIDEYSYSRNLLIIQFAY